MNHKSRATAVTFFEDRARVVRTASFSVTAGVETYVITGVSALIDDSSLVVTSTAGRPKAVNVVRALDTDRQTAEERESLTDEVQRLQARLDRFEDREQELTSTLEALLAFEEELLQATAESPSEQAVDPDQWEGSLAQIQEQVDACLQEIKSVRADARTVEEEHDRAVDLRGSLETGAPRLTASVEVQLENDDEAPAEITLQYFVPCALWRPSHRARLIHADSPQVEVTTLATVWQATGERWDDVEATFSTARLSRPSTAPLLSTDLLQARPRAPEERKTIHAEFRDQLIEEFDSDDHRRSVQEMPGIDDGGRPLTFSALRPLSLKSDGEPVQIECDRVTIAVDIEELIYPELMDAPHRVARGTWRAESPLLAGPIALIRESEFAGRTRQDFVAIGEPLRIGFGPNDSVRVQRRVDQENSQAKITGRKSIQHKVSLYASNLSGRDQTFEIVERVPVSELAEITIEVDGHRPDRDGFVRIPLSLKPRETRKISFSYRISMSAQVQFSV